MRDASQFPRFSDAEMASGHQRVMGLIQENGLDQILFFGNGQFSNDIYWLTDWPGGRESYVLFQKDLEPVVVTQLFNHVPMARVLSVIDDVRWAGANTAATVSDVLGSRGLSDKKIGLVGPVPYRHYLHFTENNSDTEFSDASGSFRMMRTIKTAEEIKRLKKASELTDKSITAVAAGLMVGMQKTESPYLSRVRIWRKAGMQAFTLCLPCR